MTNALFFSACVAAGAAISTALATGCTPGWRDVPGAMVTAIAMDDVHQDAWHDEVADGVREWNDRLRPLGCPEPFVVGPYGHDVVLVPEDQGAAHGVGDNVCGRAYEGVYEYIVVKDTENCRSHRIVLHELGHAIGIDHPRDEMPVIMNATPRVDHLTDWDVEQAAIALGCW